MKNLFIILLGSVFLIGCFQDEPSPEIIIDPPASRITGRDTITSGSFMGIVIQSDAKETYQAIQKLQASMGVSALNIVSNFASDITQLRERIPLYSYILLDQKKGTESGVQLTFEKGKVKSIFLNSGKKLSQWPEGEKEKRSVRIGDNTNSIYDKLAAIRQKSKYAATFETVLLLTKDLETAYDPAMARSNQWYFTHKTGANTMNVVNINLRNKSTSYIEVISWEFF